MTAKPFFDQLILENEQLYKVLKYLALLVLTCYVLALVNKRRRFVALVDKVSGPRAHAFLGNLGMLGILRADNMPVPRMALVFHRFCGVASVFSENGMFRFWLGVIPAFTAINYKTAEVILSSNTLLDKSEDYFPLYPWLGTGLLTSTGSKWKTRRRLLTPAFHFRILEDFLGIINDQSKILTDKLQETLDSEWTDIVPFITMCTLDIIGETAMGVSINAQIESESLYVRNIHELVSIVVERAQRPWIWNDTIFYLSSSGKRFSKSLNGVIGFTRQVIQQKKASFKKIDFDEIVSEDNLNVRKKRLAFIDILLNEHMKDQSNFTEEDIREEVDTFLFEGHDTTAVGLSWVLYLIGLHQDVQQKIYDEFESIIGDDVNKHFTSDDLKKMKYLECVIKESQRLYPSVPYIGRQCNEEMKINQYTIPKGSRLWVIFYIIHRDPKVFPEPEVFDPDRFSSENVTGRNPFAYVPFSAGPRNCIGQRFAMMEEKTVVANILRNFVIRSLDPRDKVIPSADLILRPLNGIRMTLKRRGPRDT